MRYTTKVRRNLIPNSKGLSLITLRTKHQILHDTSKGAVLQTQCLLKELYSKTPNTFVTRTTKFRFMKLRHCYSDNTNSHATIHSLTTPRSITLLPVEIIFDSLRATATFNTLRIRARSSRQSCLSTEVRSQAVRSWYPRLAVRRCRFIYQVCGRHRKNIFSDASKL